MLANLQEGGAPAAWHEFFARYAPAVYRVARLRGLDSHDAEDIVQQVMLDVARQMDRADYDRKRGPFRRWVRAITEHKIASHFRKPRMPSAVGRPEPAAEPATEDVAWEEEWRMQDLIDCLDEVAADCAPRRVEAFRLYVLEDLPAEEVARRLDISVGNVYVTRAQILKRIRQRMLQRSRGSEV